MAGPSEGEVSDHKENGFTMESDGSVWAPSNGTGGVTDWNTLDWKEIQAAIWGASAVPNPNDKAVLDRMNSISDPTSLMTAAQILHTVQGNMRMVAKSIADQAEALAGENGVWKGEAAKAFRDMMIEFSRKVMAQANQIGGSPAGIGKVPTQLYNNGLQLQWARTELYNINIHYANEAREANADVMDNGLVYISSKPEIKEAMDNSMREVGRIMSSKYTITINEVKPPYLGDLNQPPGGGGGGGGDNDFSIDNPFDDWQPPTFDNPFDDWQPPTFDNPFDSWEPPPSMENPFGDWEPPPSMDNPFNNFETPPFDQQDLSQPPPDVSPFDASETPPDVSPFDASEPPPVTDLSELPPGAELPPGSELGAPPPLSEPPAGSNVPPFVGTPPPLGLGQNNSQNKQNLPNQFPGTTPPAGEGLPGLEDPDQFPVGEPPPGLGDLPDPTQPSDWATEGGPGLGGATDNKGLGTPPMFPPMGGMPGGGSNDSGGRSDASGLLGDELEPWTGSEVPGLGDPSGFETPVSNPEEWASSGAPDGAGSGLQSAVPPMMPPPMMPPMGGAPGGDSGAGRSDASGLLGDEVEPWTGSETPGVGDPSGVNAPPVNPEEWASSGAPDGAGSGLQSAVPPMMPPPMMPPMGGAPGGDSGAGRSDASGLLGDEVEAWAGDEVPVGDPSAVNAPPVDPEEWASDAAGSGLQSAVPPMMPPPMMPPMGGAPGGDSGASRSDASGLLGDEVEAWAGGETPAGDPSAVNAPSADPEEWASDGDGVPATAGPPVMPPPMMPPMGGAPGGDSGAGRSDASGLLGDEVEAWTGDQVPAGDPSAVTAPPAEPEEWASDGNGVPATAGPPVMVPVNAGGEQPADPPDESTEDNEEDTVDPAEDRVAVVRPPGDDEDTTAWDVVAGAGMLGFLVPLAAAARTDEDEKQPSADYALRETAPWEGDGAVPPDGDETEMSTYRRQKGGEVISDEWKPLMCSAAPPPEPGEEPEEEPEEPEEEEPRTAANLLKQSDDAWGGGTGTKPSGVLE